MIEVREIAFASPEYLAAVELRREVLRKPLGLDFTPAQLAEDSATLHFGAFNEELLVGCLILVPLENGQVKMRQVAVSPNQQRRGIGKTMVTATEEFARQLGFSRMVLHARETAVEFYLALGYGIEGEPFEEVGIPHRFMSRTL